MNKENVSLAVLMAALLTATLPSTAHAYVGPGGVITAIGAALALVVAIVASIAGFLWYPLKRLLGWVRGLRGKHDAELKSASPDASTG